MKLRDSLVSENMSRQCFHRLPVVMAPRVLEPCLRFHRGHATPRASCLLYNIMMEACCNVFYRHRAHRCLLPIDPLFYCYSIH